MTTKDYNSKKEKVNTLRSIQAYLEFDNWSEFDMITYLKYASNVNRGVLLGYIADNKTVFSEELKYLIISLVEENGTIGRLARAVAHEHNINLDNYEVTI